MSLLTYWILNAAGEPEPTDDIFASGNVVRRIDARSIADSGPGSRRTRRRARRICVSTVFLGLDHAFQSDGPPVLWETLILGGVLDGSMWRYHVARGGDRRPRRRLCLNASGDAMTDPIYPYHFGRRNYRRRLQCAISCAGRRRITENVSAGYSVSPGDTSRAPGAARRRRDAPH